MIPYLSQIKWAVGIALIVGAFFYGHHIGAEAGAVQVAQIKAEAAQNAATLANETAQAYRVTVADTQANGIALASSQQDRAAVDAAARSYTKSLQTQARADAAKNPDHYGCTLDADGLRIWRAANAAIGNEHRAADPAAGIQPARGGTADAQ